MKPLKIALLVYLIILVIYDVMIVFFSHNSHARFVTDKIPIYWTVFAVVGCFLLIKVGKGIAHLFLSKDEDFYG